MAQGGGGRINIERQEKKIYCKPVTKVYGGGKCRLLKSGTFCGKSGPSFQKKMHIVSGLLALQSGLGHVLNSFTKNVVGS